jgi:hypothetical protein
MSQADLIIGFTQGYSIQCRLVSGKELMMTGIVGFNWRRIANALTHTGSVPICRHGDCDVAAREQRTTTVPIGVFEDKSLR